MTKSIEQRVAELEERMASLENAGGPSPLLGSTTRSSHKKTSAKEFLLTKAFKSEIEKGLVLMYYLEHMEGMVSFNVDDVVEIFRIAKEKKPANPSDVIAKNTARGFVMEAVEKKDNKKTWTLTATGERYVENDLNK